MGFVRGLREQGYVEGRNLAIDYRWTEGTNEGFSALAAELVRLKADVIVAHATPAVLAAKEATATIPIVLLNVADPVGAGLVASLARPGGNVTGVSNQSGDFTGKLLELSKETVPRLARVATITPIPGPATHARVKELETAASVLGVTVQAFPIRDSTDVQRAIGVITQQKAQAVLVLPDHVTLFHRVEILDLSTPKPASDDLHV
jgi:putative ABC transport system substrate-binding protein